MDFVDHNGVKVHLFGFRFKVFFKIVFPIAAIVSFFYVSKKIEFCACLVRFWLEIVLSKNLEFLFLFFERNFCV